MAKVGEGDARWIVQERADGTNVHGWHWQERDVLKWSQARLTELLSNLAILNGQDQVFISSTKIESVAGEALINNRKKKLIPSYELAVKGQWTGEIKDGSQNSVASASGSFQLPYISDENADEDPELTVSLTDEGAGQQRLKQAFVTKGKTVFGLISAFHATCLWFVCCCVTFHHGYTAACHMGTLRAIISHRQIICVIFTRYCYLSPSP